MRQYDVVFVRLTSRTRPDEEALTDLLNERSRAGWVFHSATAVGPARLMAVFKRDTA
jgi:hypothetical protein